MIGILDHFHLALPEVIVLVTASLALLVDLFFPRIGRRSWAFVLACVGLILAGLWSVLFVGQSSQLLFNGLFVSDDLANLMNAFMMLTVLLSFIYAEHYLLEHDIPSGDYYVLGLFST